VNGAKSWLTVAFPEAWLYALGLMFILITRYLPRGLLSLLVRAPRRVRAPASERPSSALVPGRPG